MTVANVHDLPCRPDVDTMHAMAQRVFSGSGMRGLVEISWTSTRTPHGLNGGKLFDLADLDEAIEHAARLNTSPNRNVYLSAGLRKTECAPDRRANDVDVFAEVALWADFDDPGALQTALEVAERLEITPSLVVFTGNEPHLRGQLWWTLDEPCEDLTLHRQLEEALASRLGGDPSVVNPSRVMRLAGSVAWPLKAGRALEMTGVLDAATRTEPYTLEELRLKLERAGALAKPRETAKVLDFNTAEPTLDLDDLIERAGEAGQWHRSALLAVAHLLGRGTPPDVILDVLTSRLQMPGYTYPQTRQELAVMVEGGLKRGMLRAPDPVAPAPDDQKPQRNLFPVLSIDELGAADPPAWRVQDILPQRGLGVMYGPSGTFKSFLALDLALSVAHGIEWRGRRVEPAAAIYIAGEGTYGLANRILAWRQHRAADNACSGFWLAPVAANLLDRGTVALIAERLLALPVQPRLLVVDTLARSFGSGNENDAKDMNAFVAACDYLAGSLSAFVLIVHHAGKDADRGARGSSVLRAAADVEITVKKGIGERSAILRVTKQKDAEEGSPIYLRMAPAEGAHPTTGEVFRSLVPVADEPVSEARPTRMGKRERDVLAVLEDGPQRFATIVARLGLEDDKKAVTRALTSLETKNLVENDDGCWALKGAFDETE